jgi:predicted acyltransferase
LTRRALVLIGLGLILNLLAAVPHVSAMRIPGVLQRIGLTYLLAAWVVLHTRPAGQAAVAAALFLGHWAVLMCVPFGGHPAGTLTPQANVAAYVDAHVFGWHTLTALGDPEGLLGTLSSVATALVGALAGYWVNTSTSVRSRVGGLVAGGIVACAAGVVWSEVLPLNKPLWTGSYALVMSGLACLAMAASYYAIDARGGVSRSVRPLVWLGVNPLAVYFLSEVVALLSERPLIWSSSQWVALKDMVFWSVVAPIAGDGPAASLVFALAFAAMAVAAAGVLYRRNIRVQV